MNSNQILPPGLIYQDNFISTEKEQELISWIDNQPWNTSIKRRTQHYGYEYNYSQRVALQKTTPIFGPLLDVCKMLESTITPEQCIINEYTKTQGIAGHIDALTFGPIICSVSLLNPCNMIFTRGEQKVSLYLAPRSVVILSNDARYNWKHEIKPTATIELPDGEIVKKDENYRRISLTFRTMNYK
jgi:alkylated DNA repair dioxygenase AlkB